MSLINCEDNLIDCLEELIRQEKYEKALKLLQSVKDSFSRYKFYLDLLESVR